MYQQSVKQQELNIPIWMLFYKIGLKYKRRKNMKKQCIVVGLGWFGMNVAKRLSEEEIEVLAIA